VKFDDLFAGRRRIGRPPRFTDAELVTVAVAQAVLQVPSERRWLRIKGVATVGEGQDANRATSCSMDEFA
jgi:hypothetical protein